MESVGLSQHIRQEADPAGPTDGGLSQSGHATFGFPADDDLMVLSAEQRRQRIVRLFEELAPLAAQLSEELCKEDHGRFMTMAARIEERAIIIEANLTELEASLNNDDAPARPSRLLKVLALFSERVRRLVQAYVHISRQRERNLETISRLRNQLEDIRRRPQRLHDLAVEHVKRILLYDDERYAEIQKRIAKAADQLMAAERSNHYTHAQELREATDSMKAQLNRLSEELSERALLQVQESDNGPRQK